MTPADFTLEFYRKCLSQHNWKLETTDDHWNQQMLHHVGLTRKGDFWREFKALAEQHKKHFPVASQGATETQNTKPNTTMNTLLKDIYETLIKPLVDAIDRNTAAKGVVYPTCAESVGTGAEAPAEDKPAEPKKRGPKAKAAEPAPEPTPVVEPEVVQEEEPYLTGPELVELMKPLKDTPYTKKLVEFRDGTLGFPKMTREMSDSVMLRQMEAKIRECLAAHEEDQKDAA
jgi:hypothetical protein